RRSCSGRCRSRRPGVAGGLRATAAPPHGRGRSACSASVTSPPRPSPVATSATRPPLVANGGHLTPASETTAPTWRTTDSVGGCRIKYQLLEHAFLPPVAPH